jgi:hypothetical protein
MDARDFFPIAEAFRTSTSEAERRTSVGRSYYALFNVLLGALSAKGVIFKGVPEDHYKLVSYLAKSGHTRAASVGSVLKDLRLDRNRADYDLTVTIAANTSAFRYQKAIRALEQFDSIPTAEWTIIVKAIQALP